MTIKHLNNEIQITLKIFLEMARWQHGMEFPEKSLFFKMVAKFQIKPSKFTKQNKENFTKGNSNCCIWELKIIILGASLVAQWLRVHLPLQEARVQSLVWEDLTCRRATKPVRHNCWACALEPASHNYWRLRA